MRKPWAATFLIAALTSLPPGCVHSPKRSSQMVSELRWLDEHGFSRDGVDLPRMPWLALVLDILPIPGVGHYYVGDVADGLKTTLLFWAVVPWILGPIDAYREATYKNDVAYLDHARASGWLDGAGPAARPEEGPHEDDARPEPTNRDHARSQARKTGAAPTSFCAGCGNKLSPGDAFCASCGAKRR